MTDPLTTANAAAVAEDVTQPCFLITIAFSTPVRLSTLATDTTYDGDTYTGGVIGLSGVQIASDGMTGRLTIHNSLAAYTTQFATEGPGKAVTVTLFHGDPPFSVGDGDQRFSGVTGRVSGRDHIEVALQQPVTKMTPSLKCVPQTNCFNHMMTPGYKRVTANGVREYQPNRRY